MPAREPKPGQFRLKDFADQDRIMMVRCGGCRKTVRYLIDDLVAVLGGDWDANVPPFACGTCKSRHWMGVKLGFVTKTDVGIMEVRRPWKVITIQKWKTVKLGDELPKTETADPAVEALRYR
jgi:hypothetical protein